MPFHYKLNALGEVGQKKIMLQVHFPCNIIIYEGLEHFILYLLIKVLRKKNVFILSKLETETDGKKMEFKQIEENNCSPQGRNC